MVDRTQGTHQRGRVTNVDIGLEDARVVGRRAQVADVDIEREGIVDGQWIAGRNHVAELIDELRQREPARRQCAVLCNADAI